jgi:hypothetical protein
MILLGSDEKLYGVKVTVYSLPKKQESGIFFLVNHNSWEMDEEMKVISFLYLFDLCQGKPSQEKTISS